MPSPYFPRFPVAAYAAQLSPARRDQFPLFALSRPYDATLNSIRSMRRNRR